LTNRGMTKVAAIGEILVEIMADARGQTFLRPGPLTGPYASGAPAIFIDQVARLGQPCGMVGRVGDDDFGRMNVERLRADGVDVTAVGVDARRVTGSAFVRYRDDGERDFVFNVRDAACGHLVIDDAARAMLAGCGHLHVMGSSLFSPALTEAVMAATTLVKQQGGMVSFDPNLRKEMLGDGLRAALARMLRQCDLFLPSGGELTLLTDATTQDAAVAEILGLGVAAVVLKQGAAGASYFDRDGMIHADGYQVIEVDPTGAGDCFGATFVTCRLQGRGVAESLAYANASGALAVTRRGPMEGASSFAVLDALIAGVPP